MADPIGHHNWKPSVDSESAQVGDLFQFPYQRLEDLVDDGPWIAAAENHFVDGRIGRDGVNRRLPLVRRFRSFRIGIMATETIPTMNGAGTGRNEQDAGAVFLQEPWFALCRSVVDRIWCEARHLEQFVGQRKNLSQQRIVGVADPHSGDVAPRRKEPEFLRGALCGGDERRRKF